MKTKIIIILLFLACSISCSKKENSVYILPENYKGYIIVVYNQKNGTPTLYENDKRIYRIPPSGILKTQFDADYGWSEFPEFYYEKISSNNKLPLKFDFKEVPNDSTVCFGGTTGTVNKNLEGTETIKFTNYYIGNKKEIENAIKAADSIDYNKLGK
ncbi:DUF6843 domain-containing protein [Flavobacterium sp. '19STA2R22 D10 B1']|uniref:DUF6843 domain-containing protein n=1 Tax=Flavobacterium aerium TaxID=3037261 RepID=UPI00278BC34A|nr:hypothetical protein [Flavobacterium sp. '19STA2R22 D10 B1']